MFHISSWYLVAHITENHYFIIGNKAHAERECTKPSRQHMQKHLLQNKK